MWGLIKPGFSFPQGSTVVPKSDAGKTGSANLLWRSKLHVVGL